MNTKDLTDLGISEEVAAKIFALHGKDIESAKSKLTASATELEGVKAQLTEASTTIEGFKKLDVDAIRAAADDWKAKAEQAAADGQKQIAALRFDHALDGSLASAKAKNAKAVKALLDATALKYNEVDGSIIGLTEQLEKIKSESDYLFETDTPAPKVVAGANNQSVLSDSVVSAARAAAGLPAK